MLVIHDQTCPANPRRIETGAGYVLRVGACTCTAQADLAELVAAAEREVQKGRNSDRLDAALKPFREEVKK